MPTVLAATAMPLIVRSANSARGLRCPACKRVTRRACRPQRRGVRAITTDELVGDRTEGGPEERCGQVHPESPGLSGDERRAERPRRVHRRTGDRAAEHRIEPDGAADRDRGRLTDGARVGGDGHDHEHQEEREHGLPQERLPVRARRQRGADIGHVAQRRAQQRRGDDRAGDLCRPVEDRLRPREVTREGEGEGDGRVEVGARHVAERVDHDHDHQPERDRDTDVPQRLRLGVDHDRSAAGEHQREGADQLGSERTCDRLVEHDVRPLAAPAARPGGR